MAPQVFTIGPIDPLENAKAFELYCQKLSTLSRRYVRIGISPSNSCSDLHAFNTDGVAQRPLVQKLSASHFDACTGRQFVRSAMCICVACMLTLVQTG